MQPLPASRSTFSDLVMSDWESLPIEELVASVSSGGTPRAGDPRYYAESGTPFLKIDDISRCAGRFVDKAEQSITHLALAESAAQIFPAGTILVTMYGTMGVTKTLRAPMATNQAIAALVPPFRCDPNYLAHALSFRRAGLEALAAQTTQPKHFWDDHSKVQDPRAAVGGAAADRRDPRHDRRNRPSH